jgi:hypothetical protein
MPQAQAAQNDGLGVSPNDAPEVPPNAGSVTFAIVADRHFEDIRPSMEAARSGTSSESADRRLRARRERLQRRRYVRPADKQGRSRSGIRHWFARTSARRDVVAVGVSRSV